MRSIHIKNIGPIVDTGNIILKQFNVIVGKQSTGKSTLMKIVCFCEWVEKRIMVKGDKTLYDFTHYSRFLKELMQFHRISNSFFTSKSEIHYLGECVKIDLVGNKNVKIQRLPGFEERRHNTKISFIPSERNLVSAIKNVDRTYRSNDYDILFNHVFEWGEAKECFTETNPIDIHVVHDMDYYYDQTTGDVLLLKDRKTKISPFFFSIGVQSVLPIMVLMEYLTNTIFDKSVDLSKIEISEVFKYLRLTDFIDEQKPLNVALEQLAKVYKYSNTQIFIEEPEQNLFPESQQSLIHLIASSINRASLRTKVDSTVTLTTHSPYVITALNILLKASISEQIDAEATYAVVNKNAIIALDKLSAYYIDSSGILKDIFSVENGMIGGLELDHASDVVENKLCALNDIIYG